MESLSGEAGGLPDPDSLEPQLAEDVNGAVGKVPQRLVVGISGASGAVYGVRALDVFGLDWGAVKRWEGLRGPAGA